MSSMRFLPVGPGRPRGSASGSAPAGEAVRGPGAPPIPSVLVGGEEPDVVTSAPSSRALRPHLDIRLNGGTSSRRVLSESHLVVGRVPGVQLLLDHHTVS